MLYGEHWNKLSELMTKRLHDEIRYYSELKHFPRDYLEYLGVVEPLPSPPKLTPLNTETFTNQSSGYDPIRQVWWKRTDTWEIEEF